MQITSSTSLFRALHLQYDSALIKWEYIEISLINTETGSKQSLLRKRKKNAMKASEWIKQGIKISKSSFIDGFS
jgi:hypothetical protein